MVEPGVVVLAVAGPIRDGVGGQQPYPRIAGGQAGVVALGSALAFYALIRSILRANANDDAIKAAIGKNTKGMISPVIYVVGVALAVVTPYLAYGCYAAVSLMWIIPDRRLAKNS